MLDGLTSFAKINLAACAARRACAHPGNPARFDGEYATAIMWRDHRVVQTVLNGQPYGYIHS